MSYLWEKHILVSLAEALMLMGIHKVMSQKDIWICTLHTRSKIRCDTHRHVSSIWFQSEKTFPVKFYLEKKWFMALNISVAFLISKRTSQNRNYSLIFNISLAGGLKVGLLRTSNTCVQLHAEWREHSWEIYQDLLRFPEERLVIQKYDVIWQRYACMSFT